jgi:hypothetical protein
MRQSLVLREFAPPGGPRTLIVRAAEMTLDWPDRFGVHFVQMSSRIATASEVQKPPDRNFQCCRLIDAAFHRLWSTT